MSFVEDVWMFNRVALAVSFILLPISILLVPIIRHRLNHGEGTGFVINQVTDPVGKFLGVAMSIQTLAVLCWSMAFGLLGPDTLGVWKIFPIEVSYLGLLLIWGAQTVIFTAQYQMGKTWRMCIDEEQKDLVTGGLFSLSRNPIYACTVVITMGVFLLSPAPWSLWLISNAMIFVSIQARLEEQFLLESHGETYRHYAQKVGRFVPGLGYIKTAG